MRCAAVGSKQRLRILRPPRTTTKPNQSNAKVIVAQKNSEISWLHRGRDGLSPFRHGATGETETFVLKGRCAKGSDMRAYSTVADGHSGGAHRGEQRILTVTGDAPPFIAVTVPLVTKATGG